MKITSTHVIVPANRKPAFDDDVYFDNGETWTDLIDVVAIGDQPEQTIRGKSILRKLRGE